MKKFFSLIACLAIGYVCGWGIACHMAGRNIKELKNTSPANPRRNTKAPAT